MTGNWTFAFGEARGTRFVTDQTGAFVQDVSYQPFGEARQPDGATPGTTNYENEQWNGGDLLAAFGVVNLGARVYDPVIGRFLSRDPISRHNPLCLRRQRSRQQLRSHREVPGAGNFATTAVREMVAAEIIKVRVGCFNTSATRSF